MEAAPYVCTPEATARQDWAAGVGGQVGQGGRAVDDGEFEGFINCVAVPSQSSAGALGAMSQTTIRSMATTGQLKVHLPLLLKAAALISRKLG